MNRFTAYRPAITEDTHNEDQANAPDEPQFEGVVFTDGTCVIRWLTAIGSTSVWASFGDMLRIHGHPEYGTRFVFHDEPLKLPWDIDKKDPVKPNDPAKVPNTFEEAIQFLLDIAVDPTEDNVSFEKLVQKGEEGFCSDLHMGLGMWIRNNWGLWNKEGGLYTHFISLGIGHPDDMSSILITTVYRRYTGLPDTIEDQVERYQKFWLNEGIDPLTQKKFGHEKH